MNCASYPIARLFTSIAVCLTLLCAHVQVRAAEPAAGQVVGFEDGNGKTVFLHDFKGRPVLINLWASWCEPCVKEMPSLARLQQDYANKGLAVVALSEDDAMDGVKAFYAQYHLAALAPYFDKGHGVYAALQPRGLPTTLLISRDGVMVQRIEGPVDWQSPEAAQVLKVIVK